MGEAQKKPQGIQAGESSSCECDFSEDERRRNTITIGRLEDQICWYDRKSRSAQSRYKSIKIVQIAVAAAVPLATVFNFYDPGKITAVLGLTMLILEGLQQLNQYQESWITYRSTCEALKHEKFTFLAGAGPYSRVDDPNAILADRIEGLISQEHAKWVSTLASGRMSDGAHPVP